MADIILDEGLGDLLAGDDDLLSLLESVQNEQDNGGSVNIPDSSSDDKIKSDSESILGSSEDAFKELMGSIDIEGISVSAEQKPEAVRSIDEYDKSVYGYPQLDEIEKGIKRGLNVSLYDSADLSFRQMREIRIGLEQGLDVSYYTSKYYKDTQMREIRLGLMEGLDVGSYARLIYSLPDMQRIHRDLKLKKIKDGKEPWDMCVTDMDTEVTLSTVDDGMEAYMKLKKKLPDNYSRKKLEILLSLYGICSGLKIDEIDPAALKEGEEVLVAKGSESVIGENGWYEYFVDQSGDGPHVNEDGSIDYMAQRTYSFVQPGQRVALYHPATSGQMGRNVFGMDLPTVSGKNLPRLSLDKIRILDDGVTYVSKKEGLVSVKDGILNIVERLEFKEDVGYGTNVSFDGDIYVHGSVLESAVLQAGGDIIIDGSVEAAIIKAGGDVVIRRGMNPDGKGELEAGGNVVAGFLENANVVAEGNVEADYILNSNVFCKGTVTTRGRRNLICGGHIVAGEGIKTANIGNEYGTRTEAEVGLLSDRYESFNKLRKRRRELEEEMEKVRDGMNQVLRKVGALNGRTNPIYIKLQDVLEQQKKEYAALEEAQEDMDDEIRKGSSVLIEVSDTAYRNTKMVIGGNSWLLDKDIERSRFFARGRAVIFEDIRG